MFKRKEESHVSLNQKLDMIKLGEESMLEIKKDQKLGLLHPTVSQDGTAKERLLKEIESPIPVNI